ncbi:hypothetical protein ABT324_28170 [Saccharopolyspora sp. NPDC000359]|uniref:hypothetical protein n=1 Tax=Saccharopolyspora sp. NPDC000359 TaxID=3154251 RepID=UPI0033285272
MNSGEVDIQQLMDNRRTAARYLETLLIRSWMTNPWITVRVQNPGYDNYSLLVRWTGEPTEREMRTTLELEGDVWLSAERAVYERAEVDFDALADEAMELATSGPGRPLSRSDARELRADAIKRMRKLYKESGMRGVQSFMKPLREDPPR